VQTPPVPSAEQLDLDHQADVKKRIGEDSQLSLAVETVQIAVKAGVVTLTGSVSTPEERARAEEIARTSPATVSVDNQLTIEPR